MAQAEGEVSDIYPKVGELVGTGSPIMSIAMTDDLWGTFNVREDQLEGMTIGSTIKAFVPAFKKEINLTKEEIQEIIKDLEPGTIIMVEVPEPKEFEKESDS